VPSAARSVERHAELADAFVESDYNSGEWTIGNAAVRYSIAVARDGSLRLIRLVVAGTSQAVTLPRATDASITVDDDVLALGSAAGRFLVSGVSGTTGSHYVSLAIRFTAPGRGLAATRYYVVYPGAAVVEAWTTIETLDATPREVRNLSALQLVVDASDVDYVTGLDTPADQGGAFSRRRRTLETGERLMLGSSTLSTEHALPFVSVDAGEYRVFGGLAWSGGWSASLERAEDSLAISLGLPEMSAVARPGEPVEGPHAFFGVARGSTGDDVAAMTRFVHESRAGRPFPSLTTYNTWFVHGINIDESVARRDIEYASTLGVELFQLDAGWYRRTQPQHPFDFTEGLGSWEVDRTRFPSGLPALAAHAHAHDMQFGIWVEPERVALSTVGLPGLAQETYLAQQHGQYQPGVPNGEARDGQICLAYPQARQWVKEKLFALLDEVRPDNLKWDFNRWVHCTRADHGHPVDGGNYAHTMALYELLAEVRERYPSMTVENCAGGGHRVDLALARLTDTAWMDDRSAPSGHVRRNLNGLLAVFPAPYLFSYVMAHSNEPLQGSADLPLTVRSRMPGVVGLAAALDTLSEGELNVLHQEFALAKRLRGAQQHAVTYTLTPQRNGDGDWEVVQQWIPESGTSYFFAYAERASGSIRVRPYGVNPDLTYELRSADRGIIGRLLGADLLVHGLEVREAPESAAQLLVLEPMSP
jgi:alpha-galactosidase